MSEQDEPDDNEMPEIEAGDVVLLDGFGYRPILAPHVRVVQDNDGVRAIYRCIWRRDT